MAATTSPNATPYSDGVGPTQAGSHSGLPPTQLAPNQIAFAVNTTNRNSYSHTRPPWRKITLSYPDTDVQAAFRSGIYQAGSFYSAFGNNPSCLVVMISGRIYRIQINGRKGKVNDITPVDSAGNDDPNDPLLLQGWMSQGQEFLLISNGVDTNIVFDGASTFRLTTPNQLPTCCMSHYCNGRFIAALPSEPGGPPRSYIASDLVYNRTSGTAQYQYRDAILYRNDNIAILNGASFAPPLSSGPITALFSVAIPDTSLGQGPLQVSTLGGIYSVDLPLDATLWTTTQQPTQTVSLPNGGVSGQNAVTTVNGDALYRGPDGIRSFITARRDFNTWVQTAMSFEMARVLPYDTQALLGWASAVDFNNRLLVTCSPYDTRGRGIAHRGIIALDFNNISSLTTRSQPCYDGLWTGQPVLQVMDGAIGGTPRCFTMALDGEGKICLYEIGSDGDAFFDFDGVQDVATECWIESGALIGKEGDPRATVFKRLVEGQLWLDQMAGPGTGQIAMSATFISDQLPCWQDWTEWTLCAPMCATPVGCAQPTPTQPQYATFLRLPQPPDSCNSITSGLTRTGYYFQVRLYWAGHVELRKFLAFATPQAPNLPPPLCLDGEVAPCQVVQCCPTALFTYSIETPGSTPSGGDIEWDFDSDQPTVDVDTGSTITVT